MLWFVSYLLSKCVHVDVRGSTPTHHLFLYSNRHLTSFGLLRGDFNPPSAGILKIPRRRFHFASPQTSCDWQTENVFSDDARDTAHWE